MDDDIYTKPKHFCKCGNRAVMLYRPKGYWFYHLSCRECADWFIQNNKPSGSVLN